MKIDFAVVDFTLSEAAVFRAGIVPPPLERLNVHHDAPTLDLMERPLVNRRIIPTTLSESDLGFCGMLHPSESVVVDCEACVVNGFPDVFDSGRLDIRGAWRAPRRQQHAEPTEGGIGVEQVCLTPDQAVREVPGAVAPVHAAVGVFCPERREVRRARFLRQCAGKDTRDPIRRKRDILITAGATVSVNALNLGAKRAVLTLEALAPRGALRCSTTPSGASGSTARRSTPASSSPPPRHDGARLRRRRAERQGPCRPRPLGRPAVVPRHRGCAGRGAELPLS